MRGLERLPWTHSVVTYCACVARGSWHGDVAIRVVQMDPDLDNQVQLQKFKQEVSEAVSPTAS